MLTTPLRPRIAGPAFVEVELLETRLLFAADGNLSVNPITELALNGGAADQNGSSTSVQDSLTGSSATTFIVPNNSAVRVDTFELAAGPGTPTVGIQLTWPTVSNAPGAYLSVLDVSGATLYQIPIDQVGSLDDFLSVAVAPTSSMVATLEVTLNIQRNPTDSTDPGSYTLLVRWVQPETTAPEVAPIGSALNSGLSPSTVPENLAPSVNPSPPQYAGPVALSVTGALPLIGSATFTTAGSGQAVLGATSPIASGSSIPLGTGNIFGPALPMGPGSGLGLEAGAGHGSADAGPRAGAGTTGIVPAPAILSIGANQGPALILGPLPLGVSTPDGGIFTRSHTDSTPIRPGSGRTGLASGTFLTLSHDLNAAIDDRLDDPGDWTTGVSQPSTTIRLNLARRSRPLGFRLIQESLAGKSATTGTAFLPPISAFALVDRPTPPSRRKNEEASRQFVQRGNSIVGTLVALAGSVVLVLKVSGPELVRVRRG